MIQSRSRIYSLGLAPKFLLTIWCSLSIIGLCTAQKNARPLPPLSWSQGKLQYVPDSFGNRIPDFSYCGYKAGEQVIPDAPVKVVVPLKNGDATLRIQAAINYVSKLPADKNGLRGTVLLQKGIYHVEGGLTLHTSGIVLRGSGMGNDGTILLGEGKDRTTLITIGGTDNRKLSNTVAITDDYVPVNANTFHVAAANFKKGDQVIITRPSTKEWIETLGTQHFGGGITALGWKADQRNIYWQRAVTNVDGNTVTVDAPVTTAIEKKYGGATIASCSWTGLVTNVGVENIQLKSAYDASNPKDEAHRWMAITIDNAENCWVRQVIFKHFAGSAVAMYSNASKITVEDCASLQPVSEIGGERRNTFFVEGQQVLVQRCYAENGMHDFATGFCAPGPNAFVNCESKQPYSFSGGIDSWSSGVLFDVMSVDGNAISLMNRGQDGNGAGWNLANSVLWNCSASRIDCYRPPTAQNWSFGSWSQFSGDGYWGESNNSIEPRSLYYAQLKERIGASVKDRVQVMNIETDATSSPTVEVAAQLTKIAVDPFPLLLNFINDASKRQPISIDATGIKAIDEIALNKITQPSVAAALQLKSGWLVRGGFIVSGNRLNVPWWNGSARSYAVKNMGTGITRYVPGKIGKGLTDELEATTDSMKARNILAIDHNYGLWYERRRDDHERIRRMDGDVWAPFYELPFARSGKETAWDGLSKYDLTKYNYWYWNRLKQFADLADQKGLLLIHQNYFQHNIIEAGAHYADFPWRPANNINNTGFPEPVPYAGDKRIFMAEQFYDTAHVVRRELHRKYIRQCLDNFERNTGVIQMIGEEYTGPLHFVQFWLNTIREWRQEKNINETIALSTTKDVQDSILADAKYADVVDVIDIKYWHYQADGSVYAPQGGQNLAPRQHARLLKPKATSAQQVYRAVKEYKLKFSNKAVIYSGDSWDKHGWAVLMAGGSMPNIKINANEFAEAVSSMKPVESTESSQWVLQGTNGFIVYDMSTSNISFEPAAGTYEVNWINTTDGRLTKTNQKVQGNKNVSIKKPDNGQWVLWLKKATSH